jgi:hypothetical protein
VPGWVDFAVGFRCARDVEEIPLDPAGTFGGDGSPCGDEGCGQENPLTRTPDS